MLKRWLAVVVAAVMIGPLFTESASAMEYYHWLSCPDGTRATGELEVENFYRSDITNRTHIELEGTIQPCRQPDADSAFGVAAYWSGGAKGSPVVFNPEVAATGRFKGQISLPYEVKPEAICLITDNTTRIACYAFSEDRFAKKKERFTRPISVDKKIVRQFAEVDLSKGDSSPECPSCWFPEP